MNAFALSLLTALALLISACHQQMTPHHLKSDSELQALVAAPHINVFTEDGSPLKGAQVLIGMAPNDPFAGNLLTTNDKGQVLAPKSWSTPQPVTVSALGYVKVTYLDLTPGNTTFKLRAQPRFQQLELKGNTSGLPIKNKDGYADFAMVMPALTKADMLSFDLNQIVSPQMDQMAAMGQTMDVPSNISFPKQVENYLFFSITLDKPLYRLYFGNPGAQRIYTLAGRFPFKSTADGMLGDKSFLQLLNNFEFNAGALRDIDLQGNAVLDMPTQELRFNTALSVQAPTILKDESYLAVAISSQGDFLVPTDVRLLKSQERMNLRVLSPQETHYLAALKKTSDLSLNTGDRLSAALLPVTSAIQPQLLPMVTDPTLRENGLEMPALSPISGVMPLGTKLVYSVEEEVTQGKAKLKVFSPQWEIYSTQWETLVSLPDMIPPTSPQKKKWEVKFIGGLGPSQVTHGPDMIENASHVTQSSIVF